MFFTVLGQNTVTDGVDPIFLGMVSDIPYIVGAYSGVDYYSVVVGIERTNVGWEMGKGLIADCGDWRCFGVHLVVSQALLSRWYGRDCGVYWSDPP